MTQRSVVGMGRAVEAVARTMSATLPLRVECRRLLERHAAGLAGQEELHRYQTVRLRVIMLESANRGVHHRRGVAGVMAHRARLDFHAVVDRSDPFPEPQPS